MLGEAGDITVLAASSISTLSGLHAVLTKAEALHDAEGARAMVLKVLALRIGWLPSAHRRPAWRAVLLASDKLRDPHAHTEALMGLATLPRLGRAASPIGERCKVDCIMQWLDALQQRAARLPAPYQAIAVMGLLSAIAQLRRAAVRLGVGRSLPPLRLQPYLALALQWQPEHQQQAIERVIEFYALEDIPPPRLWQNSFREIWRLRDPRHQAWAVSALIGVRSCADGLLIDQAGDPVELCNGVLTQARRLPPEAAAQVGAALARWQGRRSEANVPSMPAIRAILAFGRDRRLDQAQRATIVAPLAAWLSHDERAEIWRGLMMACQRDGLNESRRQLLAQLVDALLPRRAAKNTLMDGWHLMLDSVDAASGATVGLPADCMARDQLYRLVAHLCVLMAQHGERLPRQSRLMATEMLLARIDRLPATLRGKPIGELLKMAPRELKVGIVEPRLASVSHAVRAEWLAHLVAAPGAILAGAQKEPRRVPTMLTALRAAVRIAGPESERSMTAALACLEDRAHGSPSGYIDFAQFVSGLPAVIEGVDLTSRPTLATTLARLAVLAYWLACREPTTREAEQCDAFADTMLRTVNKLPFEQRTVILLSLLGDSKIAAQGSLAVACSTAWILTVAATLPLACRTEILLVWVEQEARRSLPEGKAHGSMTSNAEAILAEQWTVRCMVWRVVMALPSHYQGGLLCACTEWFHGQSPRHATVLSKLMSWRSARAEWEAAVGRLPGMDALTLTDILDPEQAVWRDLRSVPSTQV